VAAAADKTKKTAEKDKAAKPRSPILITALVAVLAAAAAGGGVWFFTQSKHEEKTAQAPKKSATPAPAQYFALDPAFVVNLNGPVDGPRYLQLEVQLMTRDPAALEAIKTHARPSARAC
jgi:flagellar FliL protein